MSLGRLLAGSLFPLIAEQQCRRLLLALLFTASLLLYLCLLGPQLKVACDQACLASVISKKSQFEVNKGEVQPSVAAVTTELVLPRASITLQIPLNCRTAFADPRHRQVYAAVPFRVMHVRVGFHVSSPCTEMSSVINKNYNFSVGMGLNEFEIRLSDAIGSSDGLRYHFKIFRRRRLSYGKVEKRDEARAFKFKQDCAFVFDEKEACGPVLLKEFTSWGHYLSTREHLPRCDTSSLQTSSGFWALPCNANGAQCSWNNAEWHIANCRSFAFHPDVSREIVAGKTILFLGDSTLRGVMYSMIEKINGSLQIWRKAHDAMALSNVNPTGRTNFLFNYYPPFKRSKHAADICEALRFHEKKLLSNSRDAIVVIGGVQWLTTSILENVYNCLLRIRLNVPVIVKGIGSGFFLPMKNLKFASLVTQQCLLFRQDLRLVDTARRLGFTYLPTFNLTWSRFREFHPGKCACHFHTVQKLDSGDHRVVGPVHHAYVDILWNLLFNLLAGDKRSELKGRQDAV